METKVPKIPNILRAKVAVVGEPQVGKSALCAQLSSDGSNFPKNYLMTVGADIKVKTVHIPDTDDTVQLFLSDCSGKEIYREMFTTAPNSDDEGRSSNRSHVWQGIALLVAMYDVCKEETFGSVTKWVEIVTKAVNESFSTEGRRLTGVLLANKTDLTNRRVVSPKMGSELAQQLGLMYFECSCKDYVGVEEPFYYLANEFHKLHAESAEGIANIA